MTRFGSGQEKARRDDEFHVAMERLLLIQRKMEQENEKQTGLWSDDEERAPEGD